MGALIALHFRLMWRGTSTFLRMFSVIVIVSVLLAVAKGHADREAFAGFVAAPMGFLLVGIVAAIGSGESMAWFSPLPRSGRTWARLSVLALSGAVVTATILAVATHVPLPVPWPQLAANIWCCWIGGGLLLLYLGDLVRSQNPAVQIACLGFGVVPGIAMASYHIVEKCPWEVILVEAGMVAVLVALTRIINVDTEMRRHDVLPKMGRPAGATSEETGEVFSPSSSRKLERVPSVAPILLAGLIDSRPSLVMVILFLLASAMPILTGYAMMGLTSLPIAFQAALNHWRPFQSVPLSRPKVFFLLTAPVLAVWAVMVAVHCVSVWAFADTHLVRTEPDGLHWKLPASKRSRDAELSVEFRRGPLPRDPERLAALLSEAYRAAYGLEIAPAQFLAIRVPADTITNETWLETVEKHFEGAVFERILGWSLLMGMALLAMGLFSMIGPLPGRLPMWIRWFVLSGAFLTPMMLLVILSLESNVISNHLPDLLRPGYLALYDRPGTLTVAFAAASVALFLRHLRVFGTSEIVEQHVRM